MLIGYARTSTLDQAAGLEAQLRNLKAAGAEKIFCEQVSSFAEREQLRRALEFIREDDALIVTRLDRLARSVRDLLDIVDLVEAKRVALRILTMGLDTRDATGRLMLQVLGAVAEFERSLMLEQRKGIAKARQAGRYKGRKPTVRARREEIAALVADGLGPTQVARQLGTARSSAYRIAAGG